MTCLERLALAERVEDRRDRAELERVRAEEHQVVQHPVQLGQQGARPDRAHRDLHAEHPLGGQDHAELVGEGGQPVVPVGQHDDLPVVADLEELLGAAVHVADDRLARRRSLAVEGQPQPQHAVGGRVLRADVEHHVGGGELARTRADADGRLPASRLPSLPAVRHLRSWTTVDLPRVDQPFDPPGEPWVRVSPRLATLRRRPAASGCGRALTAVAAALGWWPAELVGSSGRRRSGRRDGWLGLWRRSVGTGARGAMPSAPTTCWSPAGCCSVSSSSCRTGGCSSST